MRTFRCYSVKLTEKRGWPTKDKRPVIEIKDTFYKKGFVIHFGKRPRVEIWDLGLNGDFEEQTIYVD